MSVRPKLRQATKTSEPDVSEEFRGYLQIDTNDLNEAMAGQADLFFRVAEAYADVVSKRDAAKEYLNTVDAEIGLKLRTSKKQDEKVTEGSIKDQIQNSDEHQAAFESYAELRKQTERLTGLKEAFQERGRMLRDLGNLYATGYFTVTGSKGAEAEIGRQRITRARNG